MATGDSLEGRVVSDLYVHSYGGFDAARGLTSLNDAQQVAFRATFTDGSSGIFVASISEAAPVPALSGMVLVLLGVLLGAASLMIQRRMSPRACTR